MNTWFASKLYYFLQYLRGEPITLALRDVQKTEFISKDELQAVQARRQLEQLRFAISNVPYYQRAYTPYFDFIRQAETWEEVNNLMNSLPILEKQTVQENYQGFLAEGVHKNQTYADKTSGSSGTPLIFPCDHKAWAYRHALVYRCLASFGIQVGEPYIYVFGLHWDKRKRLPLRLRDFVLNRARISAFDIGPDKLDQHLKAMREHAPTHMIGYPSAINDLCALCKESGRDDLRRLKLKGIYLTAEPLRAHQRILIEEVTGSRCINGYGSAEGGIGALECPQGSYHIPIETSWIQVKEPGARDGEAIVTDMMLRAFPMIRYAIGDEITLSSGECACGRPHPMLGSVEGRSGQPIILPNGRRINANLPSYIFKPLASAGVIRRYRFVYSNASGLELFLVPSKSFEPEHLDLVERETRRAFGDDILFSVRIVSQMPHLPNAKHRDYIQLSD